MTTAYTEFCPVCGNNIENRHKHKRNKKYRCPECGALHYGIPEKIGKVPACQNCERVFSAETWAVEPMEDWEILPASKPCAACQEIANNTAKLVKAGGVLWRCVDCRMHGVFKADHPIAIAVRKRPGTALPKSVGIELDKTQCPCCTGRLNSQDMDGLTFDLNQL